MSSAVQLGVVDRTVDQKVLVPYPLRVVSGQSDVPHCVSVYLRVLASDVEL